MGTPRKNAITTGHSLGELQLQSHLFTDPTCFELAQSRGNEKSGVRHNIAKWRCRLHDAYDMMVSSYPETGRHHHLAGIPALQTSLYPMHPITDLKKAILALAF